MRNVITAKWHLGKEMKERKIVEIAHLDVRYNNRTQWYSCEIAQMKQQCTQPADNIQKQERIPLGCLPPIWKTYMIQFQWPPYQMSLGGTPK